MTQLQRHNRSCFWPLVHQHRLSKVCCGFALVSGCVWVLCVWCWFPPGGLKLRVYHTALCNNTTNYKKGLLLILREWPHNFQLFLTVSVPLDLMWAYWPAACPLDPLMRAPLTSLYGPLDMIWTYKLVVGPLISWCGPLLNTGALDLKGLPQTPSAGPLTSQFRLSDLMVAPRPDVGQFGISMWAFLTWCGSL